MLRRFALLTLLLAPSSALAFEIRSPVSEPCHEEITLEAARSASFPDFAAAPAPTEDQRRAMNDLVFDLPEDNVWMLALLIGVRSNDIEDRQPSDVSSLIHVHDDPEKQSDHCIRGQADDGVAGNTSALASCRAFILGELEAGGLLADQLDLDATEGVSSYFKFRGKYTIALPAFAYRLGRALHATEDSFAHAMRDPDNGNVISVLNYIDAFGSQDYDEVRDGYPHLAAIDDCRRTDEVQVARITHAREAAIAIIAAIADPAPGRRARVEAALDTALVLTPNCSPENNYCDASELAEPKGLRTFGCQVTGASSLAVAAVLAFLLFRRRRAAQSAILLALIFAAPSLARAQTPDPVEPQPTPEPQPAPAEPTPLVPDPEQQKPPEDTTPDKDLPAQAQDRSDFARWHFDARVGGAWDDGAASGALGFAVDYKQWSFGLYGEWNPFLSFDEIGSVRAGVANGFLAVSYRWYHSNKIALSTRIEGGASVMLFDLLGIDKYTTGIYFGGALTSVRFPLGKRAALTFDPIHFALPTPRPGGIPFFYKQYRVTVGFEIALN
jgi:hypothetical protein